MIKKISAIIAAMMLSIAPCMGTTIVITTTGACTGTFPSDWNNSNNTIEVIGGGGGGASGNNYPGGGAGGGYAKDTNVAATPGSTYFCNVGGGGAGGPNTAAGGNGSTGGDTWFNITTNAVPASSSAGVVGKGGGGGTTTVGGTASNSNIGTTVNNGGGGGTLTNNGQTNGGGGGGGAGGPHGVGAAGGANSDPANPAGGSGGGASDGGSAGVALTASTANGSNGGNGFGGTGGGAGSTSSSAGGTGTAGTGGGGGGGHGAATGSAGGAGGTGNSLDSSHGPGGGGGGGGGGTTTNAAGGAGGLYGGGGASSGCNSSAATYAAGGAGAPGIIILTYTPAGGGGGGGLPQHLAIGVYNEPWQSSAMANAPWEYRYQYIQQGWETYPYSNWNQSNYPLMYGQQSSSINTHPVLTWYYYGGIENPCNSSTFRTSPSSMNTYFTSFANALTSAQASGVSPYIFHMEPDTWGFIQQCNGDNGGNTMAWSVASSGYPGLGSLPNTAAGFAQALVAIRNSVAPNVLLAFHVSMWGSNWFPTANGAVTAADHLITFYNNLNAPFDLLFFETADADSAYQVLHPERWSSSTNWWYDDEAYQRYLNFIQTIYGSLHLKSMLWQMPVGNTLYKSVNNTLGHYQDNKAEYFLQSGTGYFTTTGRQNLTNFANAGVMAILYSMGQYNINTDYIDRQGDGITNPAAISGNPFGTTNGLTAIYPDDDGGFLRLGTQNYYNQGTIPFH